MESKKLVSMQVGVIICSTLLCLCTRASETKEQAAPSGPAAIPTTLPLEEIKLEKIKEILRFINWCLAPERGILDKEKIASEIKRLAQMEKIEDTLMVLLDAKESTLDPLRARFQPKKLTPEEKKLKPEQLKAKLEELAEKKSAQEINFEIINKVINTLIKGIQEEFKRYPRHRLSGKAPKTLKPELSSQLFEALKKGDEILVTDLIVAGVDINEPDPADPARKTAIVYGCRRQP